MPNDMYKEYQGLAGSTDPMAIQRRRELARGIQAQRRGQPVSVAPAPVAVNEQDIIRKQQVAQNQAMLDAKEQAFRANLGQPDQGMRPPAPMPGTPSVMPARPANFPGNRLPVAPMRPGDRMGQANEAAIRAFNPDMQFKIDQILSRYPRR